MAQARVFGDTAFVRQDSSDGHCEDNLTEEKVILMKRNNHV
jgi:hypothetical protein